MVLIIAHLNGLRFRFAALRGQGDSEQAIQKTAEVRCKKSCFPLAMKKTVINFSLINLLLS